MRQKHNILVVTNDHVEILTSMADNIITVSAIDRSVVKINDRLRIDRELAIAALSLGDEYVNEGSSSDLKFFLDTEVINNGGIIGVAGMAMFSFGLFLLSFWDSAEESAALVLIAGGIIGYFAINPYLLSLVDWRNFMTEEAEALLHSSKSLNKLLKSCLTMFLIVMISLLEYGMVNAVIKGLGDINFLIAMFFDLFSMCFAFLCFGLYTTLPHQAVETFSSMPFLFMIFFSTTFSPGKYSSVCLKVPILIDAVHFCLAQLMPSHLLTVGSGVEGVKALRYLFSRFYFWCIVPGVQDLMEGCPADEALNMLYLALSGLLGVFLFLVVMGIVTAFRYRERAKRTEKLFMMQYDKDFNALQIEMYGEKQLRRLQHEGSVRSTLYSMVIDNDSSDDSVTIYHQSSKAAAFFSFSKTAKKDLKSDAVYVSGDDDDDKDDDDDDDDGMIGVEYDC
jgi:hypothetical protein